jgi:hypothetical protein
VVPGIFLLLACLTLRQRKAPQNPSGGWRLSRFFKLKKDWYRINRYFAERFTPWCTGMIVIGIALLFIKRNVPVWTALWLPLLGLGVAGGKTTGYARRL